MRRSAVRGLFVSVLLLLPCRVVADSGAPSPNKSAPEIGAKCWFNAQPVRLHTPPRLILLEFWSVGSRESRDFVQSVTKIHESYRDGRLAIVALSADSCDDVQSFIRREKIPYKVGAESSSAKEYGINELPGIVLIEGQNLSVVGKWSGREVTRKSIVRTVETFLGPPPDGDARLAPLPQEEKDLYFERVGETDNELAVITAGILTGEAPIGREALSELDRFYGDNLPRDAQQDDAVTRAQDYARGAMLLGAGPEGGYAALIASGRLTDSARIAVRDRILGIAETDTSPSVRLNAAHALRKYAGQRGDSALVERLREIHKKDTDPMVRASVEQAIEELGTIHAADDIPPPPTAVKLRRMLKKSSDPTSGPWADAHAYIQTVGQKPTDQLLSDYRAFPDPPNDETGRQNATLKRAEALAEVERRVARGDISDLRLVKDSLRAALLDDPDPWIRHDAVWDGLRAVAQQGGYGLRGEVIEIFEQRLPADPDRYVRAVLELALKDLKGE